MQRVSASSADVRGAAGRTRVRQPADCRATAAQRAASAPQTRSARSGPAFADDCQVRVSITLFETKPRKQSERTFSKLCEISNARSRNCCNDIDQKHETVGANDKRNLHVGAFERFDLIVRERELRHVSTRRQIDRLRSNKHAPNKATIATGREDHERNFSNSSNR